MEKKKGVEYLFGNEVRLYPSQFGHTVEILEGDFGDREDFGHERSVRDYFRAFLGSGVGFRRVIRDGRLEKTRISHDVLVMKRFVVPLGEGSDDKIQISNMGLLGTMMSIKNNYYSTPVYGLIEGFIRDLESSGYDFNREV